MKTSSKIFIGAAVVAVAACAANFIAARAKYKKYDPVARRLVGQLDTAVIRVLDISVAPIGGRASQLLRNRERYSRTESGDNRRSLNVPATELEKIRISEDTLHIENYDYDRSGDFLIFSSPELETVIMREAGVPDEVLDYRPDPVL